MKSTRRKRARGSGSQTRSFDLRECIEEQIATGVLAPGTRVDETEWAQEFGVSRTPVREALIQLASAGILEMRPRRGFVVPELSPQLLIEMFEVMAELEALCAYLAARRMSAAEHQELVRAQRACERALESDDSDGYYRQNEIFHHVIYAGSHNSFLAEQAAALHRRLQPYRRLQLRVRDRTRTSLSEHQQVTEAILEGNREVAAQSLRNHVLVQGERFSDLMAFLKQAPRQGGTRPPMTRRFGAPLMTP